MNKLEAIKARLDAATPGPWTVSREAHSMGSPSYSVTPVVEEASTRMDAELIANSPTDLALCLKVIEVYREALEDYAQKRGYYDEPDTAREALAEVAELLK